MIPEKSFATVLTLARDHLWTAEQTIRSTSTIQRYKISQGWVGWGGGASVKRLLFLSLIRDTFVWIITGRSLKCFSRLNSNKGNNLGLYWRAVEQR